MKKLALLFAIILLPLAAMAQSTFPIAKINKNIDTFWNCSVDGTTPADKCRSTFLSSMKALGLQNVYREGDGYDEESTYVFAKGCSANKRGEITKVTNKNTACVVYYSKYMDGSFLRITFTNPNYLVTVKKYAKSHKATVKKGNKGWIYEHSTGY